MAHILPGRAGAGPRLCDRLLSVRPAINNGTIIDECAVHARARVPSWDDSEIADALTDRSIHPQLRSYLWSYPAGIDWIVLPTSSQIWAHRCSERPTAIP